MRSHVCITFTVLKMGCARNVHWIMASLKIFFVLLFILKLKTATVSPVVSSYICLYIRYKLSTLKDQFVAGTRRSWKFNRKSRFWWITMSRDGWWMSGRIYYLETFMRNWRWDCMTVGAYGPGSKQIKMGERFFYDLR